VQVKLNVMSCAGVLSSFLNVTSKGLPKMGELVTCTSCGPPTEPLDGEMATEPSVAEADQLSVPVPALVTVKVASTLPRGQEKVCDPPVNVTDKVGGTGVAVAVGVGVGVGVSVGVGVGVDVGFGVSVAVGVAVGGRGVGVGVPGPVVTVGG
jgi:hypothetical protein